MVVNDTSPKTYKSTEMAMWDEVKGFKTCGDAACLRWLKYAVQKLEVKGYVNILQLGRLSRGVRPHWPIKRKMVKYHTSESDSPLANLPQAQPSSLVQVLTLILIRPLVSIGRHGVDDLDLVASAGSNCPRSFLS